MRHRLGGRADRAAPSTSTSIRSARSQLKGFPEPTELFVATPRASAAGMSRHPRQNDPVWGRCLCIAPVLSSPAIEALADVVEAGGLITPVSSGVVMVSGGADSACAAAALAALCGPEHVAAIHVNYALRRRLRRRRARRPRALREAPDRPPRRAPAARRPGNVQARAREARYAAAERLRDRLGGRLDRHRPHPHRRRRDRPLPPRRLARDAPAARPRAAQRRGRPPAPLDLAGGDPRGRRGGAAAVRRRPDQRLAAATPATGSAPRCCPVLAEIAPEVERNIAATHAELHEEAELLAGLVADALDGAGVGPDGTRIDADRARRRCRPACAGSPCASSPGAPRAGPFRVSRSRAAQIARVGGEPEGGEVELAGGVLRALRGGDGRADRAGAERRPPPSRSGCPSPGPPASAAGSSAPRWPTAGATRPARTWRRSTPPRSAPRSRSAPGARATGSARSGSSGSKSLQDLFTDHGVPRSQRGRIPVVVAGGEVAWVAGVAVGEEFRLRPSSRRRGGDHGPATPARPGVVRLPHDLRLARDERPGPGQRRASTRIGETLIDTRAPARPRRRARRRDRRRLRRPRPGHRRGPQGRADLHGRPDAGADDSLRDRPDGGLELRLLDRLLGGRPDPQGPRHLDRRAATS